MHQPLNSKLTALALGLTILTIPTAQAEGFYVGLGIGQSKADVMSAGAFESDLVTVLVDAGYGPATASASIDDTSTGWKLFGGWQLHKNFGLELGYADLGKVKANVSGTFLDGGEGSGSYAANASSEATTWGLTALGILPLTDKFSAFAKLGFHRWDVDGNVAATATDSGVVASLAETFSDSGTDLTYGLGAKYNITKDWAVRAEWERFKLKGDIDTDVDLASISMQFAF
ncbi:MAG: outer membrane beta-barrel protein [Thiobacillus sp.]